MAEDPFKTMNLSRREYLSKFGQSVIDSPNSNISDREDALIVKEGLANQRGREVQQQFYDVAPNAREAFLEDNAVISASPQFGQVQGYMGEVRRGPTYADNVLRKNVASNLPAAYRGRFDELVDSGIGVNEARTQVELEKDDEDLGLSLIDAGIHPDEVEKLRNPETGIIDQKQARWMKSQKSRETTSRGESPAVKAMKDSYEILRQTAKDIEGEYGRPDAGTNPEYDDTVARMASLRQRILAANDSVFNPPSEEVATPPAGTAPASVAGAEVVAPTVAAPDFAAQPSDNVGILKIETDPVRIDSSLRSGSLTPEEQQVAIERLRELRSVPDESLTPKEDDERVAVLDDIIEKAEGRRVVDTVVKEVLAPAWSEAKAEMANRVAEFAKKIGKTEKQVYNAIAKGESFEPSSFDRQEQKGTPEEEILRGDADKESDLLKKATRMWYGESYQTAPFRSLAKRAFGEFDIPTNAKVLRALAEERRYVPDVQVAPAAAPPPSDQIALGQVKVIDAPGNKVTIKRKD